MINIRFDDGKIGEAHTTLISNIYYLFGTPASFFPSIVGVIVP